MDAAAMQALQALQRDWHERGALAIEELREADPASFVAIVVAAFPDVVRATLRELLAHERRRMN